MSSAAAPVAPTQTPAEVLAQTLSDLHIFGGVIGESDMIPSIIFICVWSALLIGTLLRLFTRTASFSPTWAIVLAECGSIAAFGMRIHMSRNFSLDTTLWTGEVTLLLVVPALILSATVEMFRRATVAYRCGGVMGRFLFTFMPIACSVLGWMCVGMTGGSAFVLNKRLEDPVRYAGPQIIKIINSVTCGIVNILLFLLAFTAFVMAAARRGDERIVKSRGAESMKFGLFLLMLGLLGFVSLYRLLQTVLHVQVTVPYPFYVIFATQEAVCAAMFPLSPWHRMCPPISAKMMAPPQVADALTPLDSRPSSQGTMVERSDLHAKWNAGHSRSGSSSKSSIKSDVTGFAARYSQYEQSRSRLSIQAPPPGTATNAWMPSTLPTAVGDAVKSHMAESTTDVSSTKVDEALEKPMPGVTVTGATPEAATSARWSMESVELDKKGSTGLTRRSSGSGSSLKKK